METLISDLRNFVISLVAGVIAVYVVLGLNRYYDYWSIRRLRNLEQQIADAETQAKRIESLRSSERAVLFFGFKTLFAVFTLISLAMIVPPLVSLAHLQIRPDDLLSIMMWFLVGVLSFWAATFSEKDRGQSGSGCRRYPARIERLRVRHRERTKKGKA